MYNLTKMFLTHSFQIPTSHNRRSHDTSEDRRSPQDCDGTADHIRRPHATVGDCMSPQGAAEDRRLRL